MWALGLGYPVMVTESVLSSEQAALVGDVRAVLQDLRTALARISAETGNEDERILQRSLQQLEDFFLLVVVGEFNAGKSALINALLGERVLTEGVTPTTTDVQVLRHTGQADASVGDVRTISAANPLLRDIHLVDTPGTNAIARDHELITRRFVPRADLVLFVTSADRPFTESERQFMQQIREWGKKVVIAINKVDLLTSTADLDHVVAFVRDNVRALLGFTPEVFAVSARQAIQAKLAQDDEALDVSRFPALEHYILTTLTDVERFRLKLLNPLGIGGRLIEAYSATLSARLELVRDDAATVETIRTQLTGYRQEMARSFQLRMSDLDKVLHEFENRGDQFFEDTVRVGRLFDLMNASRIRLEFEERVIADLPDEVRTRVEELIDWLVASELQQWSEVQQRLSQRRSDTAERVAGRLAGGFAYDRGRLLDTVGKQTQDALEAQDQHAEAARMAVSVQGAITSAALIEVGAVGLGTAVTLLATSTAADVTGIVAAGALAAVGFVVLPRRRRTAKRELHGRVAQLRERLTGALGNQFQREIDRSVRRIEDAIAPYVQFVEGERAKLSARQQELSEIRTRVTQLTVTVETTSSKVTADADIDT